MNYNTSLLWLATGSANTNRYQTRSPVTKPRPIQGLLVLLLCSWHFSLNIPSTYFMLVCSTKYRRATSSIRLPTASSPLRQGLLIPVPGFKMATGLKHDAQRPDRHQTGREQEWRRGVGWDLTLHELESRDAVFQSSAGRFAKYRIQP
jgi:hypothetical protein